MAEGPESMDAVYAVRLRFPMSFSKSVACQLQSLRGGCGWHFTSDTLAY